MSSLINKAQLRKYVLDAAKEHRHHAFTRVSEDFFIKAEAQLRSWATNHVRTQPSVGQTIR